MGRRKGEPLIAPEQTARQCTARSRRTKEPCRNYAMTGMTVCRLHGGKSPRGMLAPGLKHGRYSKHLPRQLQTTYEAALHDPALLELRSEIALCETRLQSLLTQLDVQGTVAAWGILREALTSFRVAEGKGDVATMRQHLTTITTMITDGAKDLEVWSEVYSVMETRRRLTETEHRRLVTGQHMLTAERANVLVAAILATIREQVTLTLPHELATKVLANLSAAFSKLALLEANHPAQAS